MALTAQLYLDARGSERFRVAFNATLRDPSHAPLDVVVEGLCQTKCTDRNSGRVNRLFSGCP